VFQVEVFKGDNMPIPVLDVPQRKPSTGARLNEGLDRAMQFGEKIMQQKQAEQKRNQENQAFMQMTGMDISGIHDPQMRQKAFESAMKDKNAMGLEAFKQQGKQGLLEQKQKFIEEILSGGKGDNSSSRSNTERGTNEGFNPENISDTDIIKAEAYGIKGLRESKDAALKKKENEKKANQTQFQSDREYHSKISQPVLDEAQSIIKQSPIKKGLINQQRRDIASGNTAGIIPYLVDATGFEAYRNPESARFKTASKQRFVETLHELGGSQARPNQFIEQQLVAAQPTLGRDAESNQTVLDLEDFVEDMKLKRAQLELQLGEEDREKFGYARNDIATRADKMMGDYADKRQDEMAYDIRQRHEQNMSNEDLTKEIVGKKVPLDTPLTLRAARILMIKNNDDEKKAQAEAKRLGFKIPLESTYKR